MALDRRWPEVVAGLREDAAFRASLAEQLRAAPYDAWFWECNRVSGEPFECVLLVRAMVGAMPDEPAADRAPRELRGLVPFEVAAVLAVAIAPLPDAVPVALPLVAIASVSRWLRRRSWDELLATGGGR